MADVTPPPLNTFEWLKLIRDVRMPAPVKNVAAWLCSFGDADGTHIYPGLDKLTLATGLSRDTAVQALAALREAGLLVRTKRGGGRGSRQSDEYQIGVPDDCDSPEQLGKLVTASYESARPTRKSKPRALNESAEPTSKARQREQNESDLRTYESDLRLYESAQPTPPPSHHPDDQPEENTAAPRRGRAADADADRGIDPDWTEQVCAELIAEVDANAAEALTIRSMLDGGAHPQAVRHKISADRFGPRSQRKRRAAEVCPNGKPIAADGSCCLECAS